MEYSRNLEEMTAAHLLNSLIKYKKNSNFKAVVEFIIISLDFIQLPARIS